jgi:hypothetical protein
MMLLIICLLWQRLTIRHIFSSTYLKMDFKALIIAMFCWADLVSAALHSSVVLKFYIGRPALIAARGSKRGNGCLPAVLSLPMENSVEYPAVNM